MGKIELTEEQRKFLLLILEDWASNNIFSSTPSDTKKKLHDLFKKFGGDSEWLCSWLDS